MTASDLLFAGVGRAAITPALGTSLMGYADPFNERTALSVRDPLNATALALRHHDQAAIVLNLDVALVEAVHVAQIQQRVAACTGVPADHVTVSATQTHSAPRTIRVWGWCEIDETYVNEVMIPGAVSAAQAAWSGLVPARVGIGVTACSAGVNRRALRDDHGIGLGQNPWDLYDPTMTVLRFESARGTLANVVHYGAHPTVFGRSSRVISRDWPGILVDRVEQLTKATTLFLNGAVGDIAPRTNSNSATGDGESALWEAGAVAALDAMRAWRSIKDFRDLPLLARAVELQLPLRPLPPLEDARRELAAAEKDKDTPGGPMCNFKHWQAVVAAHGQAAQTHRPFAQVLTALGPVAMTPFPGEPFAHTILRLRQASPFAHTLGLSTTQGNMGYFPTRESLHRGGYEVWVAKAFSAYLLGERIDDALVELNVAALREMFNALHPPIPAA
jgi:hypothetical protein